MRFIEESPNFYIMSIVFAHLSIDHFCYSQNSTPLLQRDISMNFKLFA